MGFAGAFALGAAFVVFVRDACLAATLAFGAAVVFFAGALKGAFAFYRELANVSTPHI